MASYTINTVTITVKPMRDIKIINGRTETCLPIGIFLVQNQSLPFWEMLTLISFCWNTILLFVISF